MRSVSLLSILFSLFFVTYVLGQETGVLVIQRSNFAAGALAYGVDDLWTSSTSDGNEIKGYFDIYSPMSSQVKLQTRTAEPIGSHPYNILPLPGPIVKISIKELGQGTPRNWTPYLSNEELSKSNFLSLGVNQRTKKAESNLSSVYWDIPSEFDYRYFYLNLTGGVAYLESITITYELSSSNNLISLSKNSHDFGSQVIQSASSPVLIHLGGSELTDHVTLTSSNNFYLSKAINGNFTSSLVLEKDNSNRINEDFYIKFSPLSTDVYNGKIAVNVAGVEKDSIVLSGSGIVGHQDIESICLTENFEAVNLTTNATSTAHPLDWTMNSISYGGQFCEGGKGMIFNSSSDSSISPILYNPKRLKFSKKRTTNASDWSMKIQISNSINGPWVDVKTINKISTNCEEEDIDLSNYVIGNRGYYIRFLDTRTSGTHERTIDNIRIMCTPPEVLSADNTIRTSSSTIDFGSKYYLSHNVSDPIRVLGLGLTANLNLVLEESSNFKISKTIDGPFTNFLELQRDSNNQLSESIYVAYIPLSGGVVSDELNLIINGVNLKRIQLLGSGLINELNLSILPIDFGTILTGTTKTSSAISVSGKGLMNDLIIKAPLGFSLSSLLNGVFTNEITLPKTNLNDIDNQLIYIKFNPLESKIYSDKLVFKVNDLVLKSIDLKGVSTVPILANLPYENSFSNTIGLWKNIKVSGSTSFEGWTVSSNGLGVNGNNQGSVESWLVSPQFNIGNLGALLSFNYSSEFRGNPLKIKYSKVYDGINPIINTNDWLDLVSLVEAEGLGVSTGRLSNFLINEVGQVYLSFVYKDTSPWASWKISDLTLVDNSRTPAIYNEGIRAVYKTYFSKIITATNNPTSWDVLELDLPLGLSFNIENQVLSGVPIEVGEFSIKLRAINSFGSSTIVTISINVEKADQTISLDLSNREIIIYKKLDVPILTEQSNLISYTTSGNSTLIENGHIFFEKEGVIVLNINAVGNEFYKNLSKSFTITVINPYLDSYNGEGVFKKVTDLSEIADGYFVFASGNLAIKNSVINNKLGSSLINITNNKVLDPINDIVWKIEHQNNSFSIFNEISRKYINYVSSTNISLAEISEVNGKGLWDFVSNSNTENGILINNVNSNTRTLLCRIDNGGVFGAYLQSNISNSLYKSLQLYKRVDTKTIWNGRYWSNGLPSENIDALIVGDLILNEDLSVKSITIKDVGSVRILTGASLTVMDKILNYSTSDKFVVESDANLIQVGNGDNIGEITVLQFSNSMVRNDMTFWSSPVYYQNIRRFSPETLINRFWTYNESIDEFAQILVSESDPKYFNEGEGVSIRVRNTLLSNQTTKHLGKFVGVPINGNVSVGVSTIGNGFNLVGNPYTSSINISDFFDLNQNIEALYFWTHQYPVGSLQYSNNYAALSRAGSVLPTNLEYISKGQGFIVKSNPGYSQILFTNSLRENERPFFYRSNTEGRNRIWLSLNRNNQKISQMLLAYMGGATEGIDSQIDARVMQEGASTLYNVINDEAYVIQGKSLPFRTNDVVPIGYKVLETGEYSIKIEAKDGLFRGDKPIYLWDKKYNQLHNLINHEYFFETLIGDFKSRFELIYEPKSLSVLDTDKVNDVVVFIDGNVINVESKKGVLQAIKLFDFSGKLIEKRSEINDVKAKFSIVKNGVYLLKINTAENGIIVRKIFKK